MTDKPTLKDRLGQTGHAGPSAKKEPETEEVSCGAFGYLRGIRDRASAVEFRFRDGNVTCFPYSWMGPWRYDPSVGLLIKFSGDLVYLVLIRGSNLDVPINDSHTNLTSGGLQRQRVTWIREMADEDIKRVGDKGPTIDSIEIAEFESHAELREWLAKQAPGFAR